MSILSKGFFLTEFTGFTRWIFFVGVDSISTLCIFKHFGKNEILPLQIYLWQLGTCNVSLQPNIFRVCHRQNPYNIFLCTGFPLGNPELYIGNPQGISLQAPQQQGLSPLHPIIAFLPSPAPVSTSNIKG